MPKSIVFLMNNIEDAPQILSENLHSIHYLQKGRAPEIIVKGMTADLPPIQGKAVWAIPEIDNAKVLACLMGEAQSYFVILPRDLFTFWGKTLLDHGKGKIRAFCLTLSPDHFQGKWRWALTERGKILLPLSVGQKENPAQAIRDLLLKREFMIEESLLRLFQNIGDEQAVHKIRVNARTLRSLLDFLKPWTPRALNKNLCLILKDLALDLSPIREEDVLMGHIDDFQKKEGPPLTHHEQIQAYLKELRKNTMNHFVQTVIRQNALAGIPQLREDLETMPIRGENLAHHINESYYSRLIRFQVQADLNDYSNFESTHHLRKEAKRLRYVLENLNPWIESIEAEETLHFKEIQCILGDLCDARTNQAYLKKVPPEISLSWENDLDRILHYNFQWEEAILKHLIEVQANNLPELPGIDV